MLRGNVAIPACPCTGSRSFVRPNAVSRFLRAARGTGTLGSAVAAVLVVACLTPASASASTPPPGSPAVDRHIIFTGNNSGNWGLYEANSDGSDPTLVNYIVTGNGGASTVGLSPDGRSVAYAGYSSGGGSALTIDDIGDTWGSDIRTIYTPPPLTDFYPGFVQSPSFSPDGTKIAFAQRYADSQGYVAYEIETINTDGSDLTPVADDGNYIANPSFSPDGSRIVYASWSSPETPWVNDKIAVVSAEGGDPIYITPPPGSVPIQPAFSPDGSKIAFTAEAPDGSWDLWTVNSNGSGLTQVTHDGVAEEPAWTPDGSHLIFTRDPQAGWTGGASNLYEMSADGSGSEEPFEGAPQGFDFATAVSFSPVGSSAYVTDDQYQEANFEPLLMLHSTEQWRPLNVDQFMKEADPNNPGQSFNKLCTEHLDSGDSTCSNIPPGDWLDALRADALGYIEMGVLPGYDYPTSPDTADCVNLDQGTLDCDSGPKTAIYSHVTWAPGSSSYLGYNFVDYWTFWRYNADVGDPLGLDNHQGDWEGLTVAPSVTNPRAFDFAIFAQHGGYAVYDPSQLACDQGGTASCGSSGAPTGQRVWNYVANGTHAAYPSYDDGGITGICTESDDLTPEGCHDGGSPWGANYDDSNVIEFPPATNAWTNDDPQDGNWVDWPGQWGADQHGATVANSPTSPGTKQRFECPWQILNPSDACESSATSIRADSAQAYGAAASSCPNWFGGGVAATACSTSQLTAAVRAARMGRRGSFRLRVVKDRRRAGSSPGVAQLVAQPLTAGQRVIITGRAPADTKLFIRARAHGKLFEATFDHLGLRRNGTGTVTIVGTRTGLRFVWSGPDGHKHGPSLLRLTKTPKAAQPTPQSAPHSARPVTPGGSTTSPQAARIRSIEGKAHWGCRRNSLRAYDRAFQRWKNEVRHDGSTGPLSANVLTPPTVRFRC